MAAMAMFGFLGLGFPDIDLLLLPLLHHRSIITHSILVPAIFLLFARITKSLGACGFVLGGSAHLAADVIAPPVGFGMVWLPWPIKVPLGPVAPLWIACNAVVGLVWVKTLLWKLELRVPLVAFYLLAVVLGISYSIFHENALLPLLSFTVIFVLSHAVKRMRTPKEPAGEHADRGND